jgi:hypothetical protein
MRLLAFLFFSSARASGLRATAAVAPGGGDPDLATIEARLLASYITTGNVSGLDADVRSFLPLIAPPGQFTDLNYTTGKPTGWGGYDHCLRFSEMASALFSPASAFFNSAALRSALLDPRAGVFSWFLSAQPHDDANWWYQSIGCARPVAQVTLQLRALLGAEGLANATALMDRSQWERFSSTGTNAADIALVHIGNGLVNANRSMVAEAFSKMWSTVAYAASEPPTSPEGPKTDGSFMQHGAQLYLGNYGASWTKDVLGNIAIAVNTSFSASAASLAVAAHVVLDGCARAIHWPSAQWDVAVIGRQVTGPGGQAVVGAAGSNADAGLLDPAVLRAAAAGPRAAELLALAAALENPAAVAMPARFSAFYASDYAVQTRPEYFASVRMISARTAGGECINGQGLQALHAADGAQYIMTSGREYEDIAPTWNWEMLPGTTVQRGGAPLTCETADGMGSGTMTGVMTRDNATGVAWMDLNNTRYGQSLRARKAYFFFDGVLLNLGASIGAPAGFRVTTTLDSRLLAGAVAVSRDGGASFAAQPEGNATLPLSAAAGAPRLLVAHSGMGFAELGAAGAAGAAAPASAQLLNAPVSGNWSSVGASTGTVTNGMFTLSLDHGADTSGGAATYAYAIWPAVAAPAFKAGAWRAALSRYAVVSNTRAVTAVFDAANATLYAVAWDGGAASRVPLPPALPGGFVDAPFPAGLIVSTYLNATATATVLSIAFVEPGALVTAARAFHYYFNTGAAFLPCAWPNCPGAVNAPKGYVGPPVVKWACFANGTIEVENPPTQADMPGSMLVPPLNCALA